MDQRRFIAFLFLSMAVLMLSQLVFPPPAPPRKPDQQAAEPADGKALEEANRQAAAPEQPSAVDRPLADDGEADQPPALVTDVPLQYVTLGSLDVESGYRMLVTLTNQGGAARRVELSSPRFRDLHDRSGYMGHLALEPTDKGLMVGVVGAGTPAAKAGLEVGDVITGLGTSDAEVADVMTVDEFHAALADTKPGREVTLRVVRNDEPARPITVKLMRRPLEVMRPEIENIQMRGGSLPEGFIDPPSFLVSLFSVGGKPFKDDAAERVSDWLENGNWEIVERNESSATFERPIPEHGLTIVKRYTLTAVPRASRDNENYPGYDLRLDVEVRNTGTAAQSVAYRLDGPTGLPLEGWWYAHKISQRWFSAAGMRDVAVRYQGSSALQIDCSTIADDEAEPMGGRPLAYAGVDSVYFSSVLIPKKDSIDELWFDTTQAVRVGPKLDARTPKTFTNVTCRLVRKPLDLAPGDAHRDSFQVYIGPKRPELLAQYQAAGDPNYSLRDLIYYGWFGSVARGMLWVLHLFYGIVGNYGIAIIMLTVVVRLAMFPISYKQTQNMARMQALKPELDRITEKFKTDMQKRSQAMQELYRKHKINPLGGCLPLFLQLPIFIGLYRSIMVDVELRQTPLLGHWIRWCSDLSAPDMLFDWSPIMPRMITDGIGMLGLGPYFNVLPLVTVVMFLVSMKMTMPEPTNEQAAMQQRMMKYMTIFMGLIFYKVASGLCLYFIASSIWGIGERKLLVKSKPADEAATKATPMRAPRDAASGNQTADGRNGSPGKKGPKAKRRR